MENKKEKDWFEANYLDGDKIQDGQILSSKECFDALKNYKHKLLQSIVEEIDSEYEIAKNTKEFMQRSKWNEALDSIKAKLTINIKE